MNFPRPPPNSYSSANFKQTIKHPPDSTYTNQPSPFTILKNFVSMPNFVPPTVTTDRKETRSASSYGSGMPNYDGESNINDDSFDDALMEFDLEAVEQAYKSSKSAEKAPGLHQSTSLSSVVRDNRDIFGTNMHTATTSSYTATSSASRNIYPPSSGSISAPYTATGSSTHRAAQEYGDLRGTNQLQPPTDVANDRSSFGYAESVFTTNNNNAMQRQFPAPLDPSGALGNNASSSADLIGLLQRQKQAIEAQLSALLEGRQPEPVSGSGTIGNIYATSTSRSTAMEWEQSASAVQSRANLSYGSGAVTSNDRTVLSNSTMFPNGGSQFPNDASNAYDSAIIYSSGAGNGYDAFKPPCPMCNCGVESVKLVSKTASNLNREFYKCNNSDPLQKCNFFQWVDGMEGNKSGNTRDDFGAAGKPSGPIKDFQLEFRRIFGHHGFRAGQRECIEQALLGRDVFCLMPTGGGKSLVYQLPACCNAGVAIVFSPLISLMQDQVEHLSAHGIKASYISGTQDENETYQIYQMLGRYGSRSRSNDTFNNSSQDDIKLLYITPEKYKNSPKMRSLLRDMYQCGNISRFVIDEAHCLSEWGHDFRSDYLALAQLRVDFPLVPIMALTATANKEVVNDSIRIMKMTNPFLHTQSFNRPNIHYSVRCKDGKAVTAIADIVLKKKEQTGIIYCLSKKETEKMAADLIKIMPQMKNKITFYHADVNPQEKETRQRLWSQGSIKLICATIAFGMGINKPDVRYVIHFSLPKSLTNFYQESGRAGRDGFPSECIVFYSYTDKQRICSMLQKGNEDRQQMPGGSKSIERAIANINACAEFCMNEIDCRRSLILKYFGETFPSELCKGTCDNCRRSAGSVCREDFTDQGKQATSIVKSIVDEGLPKLTLNMLTQLMSNSKEKRLERYRNVLGERAVVKLGNGKPIAKALCSRLLQTMVLMDFLREDSQVTMGQYTAEYIVLGNRAMQLLQNNSFNSRNECPIILFVPQRGRSAETVAGDDLDDEDAMLEQIDVPVVSKPLDKASGLVVKDSKIGNKSDSYSVPNKRSDATGLGKTFAEPFSKTIPSSPLPPKGATSKSTSLPVRTKPVEIIDDSDEDDAFSPYVVGKRKRSNLIMTQSSGASSPMVEAQTSAQVGGKLTSQLRTELRKWLNSYRERWENYWVYLNNSSIAEMTERVPVTLSELSEIGGFGEQKIKMHGTHILATMWAFLNKHNLLSAYPKATRPTIRECPTWMDPCSREAEAIRSEAIALSRQKQKANFTTASFSPSVPRVKEESPGKSTFNASPFAANEIEDVMEYLV